MVCVGVNAMSQNGESKAEIQERTVERLLRMERQTRLSGEESTDERQAFLRQAFRTIVGILAENRLADRMRYQSVGSPQADDYRAVDEVLAEENIRDIDVRQNGWHSPTIRVWLSGDVPRWANTAARKEFRFSVEQENYNGDPAHAVLDVRPF